MDEKQWITIYKYFDTLEGRELEATLQDNNIPVVNISRKDTAYDGAFKASLGEGELKVREDFIEYAKNIVADFESRRKELAEKEPFRRTDKVVLPPKMGIIISCVNIILFSLGLHLLIRYAYYVKETENKSFVIILSLLFSASIFYFIYLLFVEIQRLENKQGR